MPTQTELEFYKVFDIPKIDFKGCGWQATCPFEDTPCEECCYWEVYKTDYPEITDKRLLELICALGNYDYFLIDSEGNPADVNILKSSVLNVLTLHRTLSEKQGTNTTELYHAVRKIMGVE